MSFPLYSKSAGIAKGVALIGVLPEIVANAICARIRLLVDIPKGVALVRVLPGGKKLWIMPLSLASNLARIAKGVALIGVLPDMVANTSSLDLYLWLKYQKE